MSCAFAVVTASTHAASKAEMEYFIARSRAARLSQQKIRRRSRGRIASVVTEHAVDEYLFGKRIHAERIAVPNHYVTHLAGLERAGDLIDAERFRWIQREPTHRAFARNIQAGANAASHRLRS